MRQKLPKVCIASHKSDKAFQSLTLLNFGIPAFKSNLLETIHQVKVFVKPARLY